ncbi:MAG TPA: LacI family transcriptional regulator [Candidatus Blautia faecipullorum]|nr:LacI family transcriptional regulator [Candidatus Blautia faecipullorum]
MTIYDIAKLAGVSASTVSRVINNKKGVGEKKRREIEELLEKLHYIPDENARNLVTQKTHMIGILMDDLQSRHMNTGTVDIQNVILRAGYYCFIKYIGQGENALEESIKDMAMKRVEGVLLMGVTFHNHQLLEKALRKYLRDIPVILVHQTKRPQMDNVYAVGADESEGIRRCVRKLADRGRRNLVLVIDKGRTSKKLIRDSFMEAVRNIPGIEGHVYMEVDATRSGGEGIVETILEDTPGVDGMLCVNDSIAIGTIYGMQSKGKRVPEDISVIGEDNSELCEACKPRLTSMDTMLRLSTVLSAHLLTDILDGRTRNHQTTMEMEIIDRETV